MNEKKKPTWLTVARGVQVKLHPTRRHGKVPDRYFRIRYALEGKIVSESLGWASEGMTQEEAVSRRLQYIKARKGIADGPVSKAEAQQYKAQAKAEAERQKQLEDAKAVTLHDYFLSDYLPTAAKKKKPESLSREVSLFNNWIDPLLGHVRIQEIGITQWDFLLEAMVDGGLSQRTRQYACLVLRLILEHAFARKLVSEMPPRAKLIGATLKPDSNRRTRIVTNDELRAILNALAERDQYSYRLTVFCALSCCRFSEAANLEWKDVDLGMGKALFRSTKNGTHREIPLSDTLLDLLRGIETGKGRVFMSSLGKPYRQAPSSFREVVERLGLNEGRVKLDRIVFHSLRHSGATRLGQSGVPLRDMMDLAGWKTPSMALRYQHSGDAGRRRAMAALESMAMVEPAKVVNLFGDKK